jgi:hypothetical protein
MSVLGGLLTGMQRYTEAEPLLVHGYEGMKQREGVMSANEKRWTTEAGDRIVAFYEATGQPEKARLWREKLAKKKTSN